jgi:hypothetical protein
MNSARKTMKNPKIPECTSCQKLKSIVLWLIEKIRDVDAVSGEACYDMCQEAQRRLGNGSKTNRVRNSRGQKGSGNT